MLGEKKICGTLKLNKSYQLHTLTINIKIPVLKFDYAIDGVRYIDRYHSN